MKLTRFSEDRQDLIEQFVEYAQLMGLSGRDLVAIGGKIDREQAKQRKLANMEIINGFKCLPIGRDSHYQIDERFKLKTSAGDYNFENDNWNAWIIISMKTKVRQRWHIDHFEYTLPKTNYYQQRSRYALLLDIAAGKLKLNF